MVFQESKDIILNYIIECKGKASKNNVVVFMDKKQDPLGLVRTSIPEEFRTSKVTTLDIINELETANRIKVLKGKRHGQSHYLVFNHESEFHQISQKLKIMKTLVDKLSFVELKLKSRSRPLLPNDLETLIWGLLRLLVRARKIPVEADAEILENRIIELMLTSTVKNMKARNESN